MNFKPFHGKNKASAVNSISGADLKNDPDSKRFNPFLKVFEIISTKKSDEKVDLGRRASLGLIGKGMLLTALGAPLAGGILTSCTEQIFTASPGTELKVIFKSKTLEKAALIDDGKDLVFPELNMRLRYLGPAPHINDASLQAAVILIMQADGTEFDKLWLTKQLVYNDDTFDDPKSMSQKSIYRIILNNFDSNVADIQMLHTQLP